MSDIIQEPVRPTRVLIADDADSVRSLFRKLLTGGGFEVIAVPDGAEALSAVRIHQPDVVLLDVGMPILDGFEVCRRLKADPATRMTPVVLITGLSDMSDRIKGIEAGADEFLSKPVHPHELRARVVSLARLKHLIDALDSAESAFLALALTIEARDATTVGHCERLAAQAAAVGRTLGVSPDDLSALHRGGYLHDIGHVGVPEAILLKPGPLTADEVTVMRRHPELGDRLCAPLQSLRDVRPIILSHHERLDGSGYPHGLRGEEVPMLAQIIGIVDVYDALTSKRPYRDARTADDAARHLREEVEQGRFAGPYVEALLDVIASAAASGR